MPARPNILHIFTDQQRYDTIHALNNPVIRTPALDRLCREGTAFTSAYSPSPVCVPARACMMYGLYPSKTKNYENADVPDLGRKTFMQRLTEAGYRTHGIGKCHFSPDSHALMGFQTRERHEGWITDPKLSEYHRFLHEQGQGQRMAIEGAGGEMYYVPQPSILTAEHHRSGWVGQRSAKFIREEAKTGKPWYLFASFSDPHVPVCPPEPWHALYSPLAMPLPKITQDMEAHYTWVHYFQNRYKCKDQGIDQYLMRCLKAYYYALISFVDFQVGRLVEALEQTGQLDNTLIVFASDHGDYLGDYNCFGKRGMHDASARVPLICRLPGAFKAGTRVDQPVSLVDLAPTFVNLAGAEKPAEPFDGEDLSAVARSQSQRDLVFSQYSHGDAAIYMALSPRWKYFYSAAEDREFLFDRVEDPQELRNKAGVPHLIPQRNRLRERLIDFLRSSGETEGLEGKAWKKFNRPPTIGPEWKWWEMEAPARFAGNPDSTYPFLPLPRRRLELPEGYQESNE